jgi:hypothetical protein
MEEIFPSSKLTKEIQSTVNLICQMFLEQNIWHKDEDQVLKCTERLVYA